jgi:hypothetical protein
MLENCSSNTYFFVVLILLIVNMRYWNRKLDLVLVQSVIIGFGLLLDLVK